MTEEDFNLKDLLPDSRAKETKNRVIWHGSSYVPIFCANCGAPCGGVPEENMTFAFALCDPCTEKWGHVAGVMAVSEEVFWQKVKEAQIEKYGRVLTPAEQFKEFDNPDSMLSKLAREAPKGR